MATLLEQYEAASAWTLEKVAGAADDLDAPTRCEPWDVRTLLDHLLDTQRYFREAAAGDDAAPPSPTPPDLLGDDPVEAFATSREALVATFSEPGVVERTGPSLGIAFADQLLHGWDLAVATDQDTAMPEGLAAAALDLIHGQFTDEQREGVFAPELPVDDGASAQDRFLAYTGRDPAT